MLRFRWTLVLTASAFFSLGLPAELRIGVLAALALGAGVLAAVTRWDRSTDRTAAALKEAPREIPLQSSPPAPQGALRTLWSTKDELPSPSGTQLRPSAGF
jgi:hypothetical protein